MAERKRPRVTACGISSERLRCGEGKDICLRSCPIARAIAQAGVATRKAKTRAVAHRQKKAGKTVAESLIPPLQTPVNLSAPGRIGLSAACSSIWSLPLPFAASVRKGGLRRRTPHYAKRSRPRPSFFAFCFVLIAAFSAGGNCKSNLITPTLKGERRKNTRLQLAPPSGASSVTFFAAELD